MSAINAELKKVESILSKSSSGRLRLSSDALKEIDESLEWIDIKIGEFGLISVGEFIADIIEVFCQYVAGRIDTDKTSVSRACELVQKMTAKVAPPLKAAHKEYDPLDKRPSKWAPLPLSQIIQVEYRHPTRFSPIK